MYPKYYIEDIDNPIVLWKVNSPSESEIGMDDSPFHESECLEHELKIANDIRRITKREAKSLFPNLVE